MIDMLRGRVPSTALPAYLSGAARSGCGSHSGRWAGWPQDGHAMRRSRSLRSTALLGATLCAILAGATSVSAHTHPTPVDLTSPAVVYVETRGQVDISLVEHNRLGKHIGLVQRRYMPLLATGSGFAVSPSGDIVAGGAIVRPDHDRAVVYAVNQLFHERYGSRAPLPSDPFSRHRIADLPDDPINQRLQRCYRPNTTDPTGGCIVAVSSVVHVFPYVTDQRQYGNLAATVVEGSTPEVAILKVGAGSMATADLATSSAGTKAIAALGFTGVPSAGQRLVKRNAHLSQPGSKIVQDKDLAALEPLLRQGYRGGPVVGETGKVVGFFSSTQPQHGDASGPPRFVDVATIHSVLKAAQVTARRGPTDTAFENAMHAFTNSEYAASIPSLQTTVRLSPGHFAATENLRIANARKGTAADKTGLGAAVVAPGSPGGGVPWWWAAAAAAFLALLIAVMLLVRARRASSAPPPATARPAGSATPSRAPAPSGGTGKSRARSSPDGPAQPAPPPDARASRAEASRGAPVMSPSRSPGGNSVSAGPGVGSSAAEARSGSAAAASVGGSVHTFCTNCGSRLAANHQFCGWCGHPVG